MQRFIDEKENTPLVSICCITYNHKKYLRDALEGFLMQQTSFPFEIIINDDASTDGTTEIIKEYQEKYPEIIVPVFHEENQYSKGYRSIAARNIFPIARGKYFAMCEGDDYWTDPLKLQKQADFLEENPDCSCCYHPVQWVHVNGNEPNTIEGPAHISEITKLPPEEIIGGLFIRMVSIMFRSEIFKTIPKWIFLSPNGDMPIQLICATKGAIGYLGGEIMAVYRRGVEGAWSEGGSGNKKTRIKWTKKWIHENEIMLDLFNKNSGYKYNRLLKRRKRGMVMGKMTYLHRENGRMEIAGLMTKYFAQLLCITDKTVIKFWFWFLLGKRSFAFDKAFPKKFYFKLKRLF